MIKPSLQVLAVIGLLATPLHAQDWSLGVSTGPFVFGDLARRTMRIATPEGGTPATQHATLSASTRPGLQIDVEHGFAPRWAVRLQGSFTEAPLAFKEREERGVSTDAGNLDIATLALPLVFRINPRGSFRFHILGGPAHAAYRLGARANVEDQTPLFEGTRTRWGAIAGAGVAWQWSDRWALEGEIDDIVTGSPFRKNEFGTLGSVEIPKPNNIHTTVGLRWRF